MGCVRLAQVTHGHLLGNVYHSVHDPSDAVSLSWRDRGIAQRGVRVFGTHTPTHFLSLKIQSFEFSKLHGGGVGQLTFSGESKVRAQNVEKR